MKTKTNDLRTPLSLDFLGSTAANPVEVLLAEELAFKVVAVPNKYRRGMAIVVLHGGHRYGVSGFTNRPSAIRFQFALQCAIKYGWNIESGLVPPNR